MAIQFEKVIPILRIFSVEKAREFYLDFLGFGVDWEHRFEPTAPLYMQISRGEFLIHLSEHYGDGCPGAVIFLRMTGLEEFHREIAAKAYRYMRPGIEQWDWGRELTVTDPFGNRIRFSEPAAP